MPALETMTFPYKGQDITIHVRGDIAHVHVDKKVIPCMLHPGNLPMWMCNEAYFGTPDITELARHMADYHYMFNDPNRAPVQTHFNITGNPHDEPGDGHDHDHAAPSPAPARKAVKKRR